MARQRPRLPRATSLPLTKSDVGVYLAVSLALIVVWVIATMIFNTHCDGPTGRPHTCTTTLPLPELFLGSILIEAAGIIAIAVKNRKGPAWFGFVAAPAKMSLQLIAGGAALVVAAEVVTAALGRYLPFFRQAEYGLTPNIPSHSLLEFALFAVLIAPPLEEFLFRGIYFRAIWAKTGPVAAAVISSLLFTLAHGLSGATVSIFIIGLYLCYVYRRTGSIVPGIVLHGLINLSSVALLIAFGVK